MTIIAQTPDSTGIANAQSQANAISAAAQATIPPKQFVFFAAFDGTNNDRNAVYKSGSPQDTNVAQLEKQVAAANTNNTDVQSRYYPGPGTGGFTDPSAAFPTARIIEIAETAYKDFAAEATRTT